MIFVSASQRIKELRKELHLSQEVFAKEIGVSRATIASWEIGRRQPTVTVIEHICDVYELEIKIVKRNKEGER